MLPKIKSGKFLLSTNEIDEFSIIELNTDTTAPVQQLDFKRSHKAGSHKTGIKNGSLNESINLIQFSEEQGRIKLLQKKSGHIIDELISFDLTLPSVPSYEQQYKLNCYPFKRDDKYSQQQRIQFIEMPKVACNQNLVCIPNLQGEYQYEVIKSQTLVHQQKLYKEKLFANTREYYESLRVDENIKKQETNDQMIDRIDFVEINDTKVKINLKKLSWYIIQTNNKQIQNRIEDKKILKICTEQSKDGILKLRKKIQKRPKVKDQLVCETDMLQKNKSFNPKTNFWGKNSNRTNLIKKVQTVKIQTMQRNNDGFMRIGQEFQADLSKIETTFNKDQLKSKLLMQRVWCGSKDSQNYDFIQNQVRQQVYQNINHQNTVTLLNHFQENLPLFQKKLRDQDPLLIYDLKELQLISGLKRQPQKNKKYLQA